jgi:peptide-methionine (R)-S-oxide reductase
MKKRYLLKAGAAAVGAIALSRYLSTESSAQSIPKGAETTRRTPAKFEVTKTEAEWRRLLTPVQFNVLRHEATERPFSSPLDKQSKKGRYDCAGCQLPLFSSQTKFDSGTGWPSFYAPLTNAVQTTVDRSLFTARTEVHCRRCGGHLGHVFDDGPAPTHKRYCMNGVSMKFVET